MKVLIKTKGVVLTSKQKSQIERQIMRLKRFLRDVSPVNVEVSFIDQSGPNKGGVDQAVNIKAVLPKETIFIEEIDDRAMRAYQYAYRTFERKLRRYCDKLSLNSRRQHSNLNL